MKYFYDTEFIEDGRTIQLVSLGVVAEDGREFYTISSEFDASAANAWVRENVLQQLPSRSIITHEANLYIPNEEIAAKLREFIGEDKDIELWGYMCAFDHVILSQLFKGFDNWPQGWPYFSHDVAQLCDVVGRSELPNTNPHVHHALSDARWNKAAYEFQVTMASTRRW